MSYTTVYLITAKHKLKELAEYKNSYGLGMRIWLPLCEKFLGDRMAWMTRGKELWKLADDEKLANFERTCLASTFDRAVISAASYTKMAKHFALFDDKYPAGNMVNHIPALCRLLAEQAAYEKESFGICFQMTSCGDNQWSTWNQKKEEYVQYDFKKGTDHFFVYETDKEQFKKKTRACP